MRNYLWEAISRLGAGNRVEAARIARTKSGCDEADSWQQKESIRQEAHHHGFITIQSQCGSGVVIGAVPTERRGRCV